MYDEQMQIIFCLTCSGKTKLIDTLCCVLNRSYEIETIDDTITGSFQQVDLNRQLEEISQKAEILLVQYCQNIILNHEMNSDTIQLISSWEQFIGTESCNDNGKLPDFVTIMTKLIE